MCRGWELTLELAQLEEINEQLGALAKNPELMSNSMLRAIQRHRELQQDNMRDLKRTKVRSVCRDVLERSVC